MAGFYPDVPAPKMALDKDGTQWFGVTGAGAVVAVPSTDIGNMTGAVNSVSTAGYRPGGSSIDTNAAVAAVFPEPRDVAGLFAAGKHSAGTSAMAGRWEYSTNTTNGLDGTWATAIADYTTPYYAVPGYRSNILTASLTAVRGVRFKRNGVGSYNMDVAAFHVYGTVNAGAGGERLAIWHPTLDMAAPGTLFDWGDVARNTTSTRTFRVKNLSTTKTAGAVRAAMSSIIEASPTVIGQHLLSADGSTWLSQLTLGDMAPGALTGVLYLRRTTVATAQPGLWMMRVFAETTTTWT